jgi:Crinkler effector protein N-terminal domain
MNPPPVPAEKATRMITLFCWILGVSKTGFSVDIEDNKTVDHLRRVIAEKSSKPLNVDELDLWKVSSFLQVAYNSCPQISY